MTEPEQVDAFVEGFKKGLEFAECVDNERGRLGRALTEDEMRHVAQCWINPRVIIPGEAP